MSIVYNFGERNKQNVLKLKDEIFIKYKEKENNFLDEEFIYSIFNINIDDFRKVYNDIIKKLNHYLYKNNLISCHANNDIKIEVSEYSKELRKLHNLRFDDIFKISKNYIENNTKDEKKLHCSLNRGIKILNREEELYQYIKSFGQMHKAKLYSSFDKVIYQLNNQTINIIDWGCGQALATILVMDYIKEKNLNINILNITLIEPSQLALSRGLLHIDVLKENSIKTRAINKDIDCLKIGDLIIDNSNTTLHLFSNILDVEFFKLDKAFLEKIKHSQNGLNYFICVSPNINDKRNARLDMFYRYFKDNFETELISERDSDIGYYKRYEKVFKAKI